MRVFLVPPALRFSGGRNMEKRNVATSAREIEDDDTESMLKSAASSIAKGAGSATAAVKKASAEARESVKRAMAEDEKADRA